MYGSGQVLIYEGTEKEKHIPKLFTVDMMNASELIGDYPESIQKLVWRALHYKCEIDARRSIDVRQYGKECEKLTKYVEAFRNTQQLIIKMCKRHNLKWIIIEENDIKEGHKHEREKKPYDAHESINVEYFLQCPRCGKQLRQNPVEKDYSIIALGCYCENCDKYYTFYLDLFEVNYHSMSIAGKRDRGIE